MATSRRICCLCVCLLALMTACSPAAAPTNSDPFPFTIEPDNTFIPELAPTTANDKAIIMTPRFFRDPTYQDTVTRLNDLLGKQGQNVQIVLEADTYTSQGDTGSYIPKVKNELTSGNTTADAYAVYPWDANDIADNAPTMDLSSLLPTAAPIYYGKHKDVIKNYFGGKLPGLPIGMYSTSCRIQSAFMLRSDYEEQYKPEIKTLSDIFTFIDNNVVAQKKVCSVLADPRVLTMLWALEQGYYSLEFCVGGFLFARMDDNDCKPVTLEKIPGFYDFIERMDRLYRTGYFVYPTYSTSGWENIGIVRNLGDYYLPDSGNRYSWVQGKFTAHELYADYPSFYYDSSYFSGELLIPSNSEKAVDVIKFVEWLYMNQNNYNTMIYGEEGIDYSVSDGRLSFLAGGESVLFKDRNGMNKVFAAWPGVPLFNSTEYNLLPENAPINIEQLFDNGQRAQSRFPLDRYLVKATSTDQQKLLEPTAEMEAVINERYRIMDNMIYAMFMQGGDYEMNIKPLENLKNDWLVEEYAYRIGKFIKSVGQ